MTSKLKWVAGIVALVAAALLGGCATTAAQGDTGHGLPDQMQVSRWHDTESGRDCLIFTWEHQAPMAVSCW